MPDPIVDRADGTDPEHEALLADSVGLALLVVLETLSPAERLAFVLHDMFAVPFDEIAPIVDRSPDAARQLASRARRRVQGEHTAPDADLDTQREVVDAFLAAARDGDFEALLAVLDPDVVLRADLGPLAGGSREVRGAATVAGQALGYSRVGLQHAAGARQRRRRASSRRATASRSRVGGFTVRGRKIVAMDILADPERLRRARPDDPRRAPVSRPPGQDTRNGRKNARSSSTSSSGSSSAGEVPAARHLRPPRHVVRALDPGARRPRDVVREQREAARHLDPPRMLGDRDPWPSQ